MSAPLQIEWTCSESVSVLRIRGEIDLATERDLETAIVEALRSGPVVVDLHLVPFFAISGLTVLLRCRRHALLHGHALVVAAPRPQLQRLLRGAQVAREVPCVRSVASGRRLAQHIERARNPQPGPTVA